MDLYSRKIVGWALDSGMTEKLITDALQMAINKRDIRPGLIIHSDRGVRYRAQGYIDFMRRHGVKPSMSRKGNCWDNAPMESFFSRLKVELIYTQQFDSIEDAKSGIFEYIEVFYNRLRRHSAIGYLAPAEFERRAAQAA
jgi:putative transposase